MRLRVLGLSKSLRETASVGRNRYLLTDRRLRFRAHRTSGKSPVSPDNVRGRHRVV